MERAVATISVQRGDRKMTFQDFNAMGMGLLTAMSDQQSGGDQRFSATDSSSRFWTLYL
jgi:hypothetical protein